MNDKIGIITEQGDLGFGFDALNESDSKIYEAATNKDSHNDTTVINEDKK
jgi:hypothetical protein